MIPDPPHNSREALEASLTALLLGELPHEQAAALHQRLAQDAELAKLYDRLKLTSNLVREAIASPAEQAAAQPAPLKLSDERREKLLQRFKTVTPKEFAKPPRRRRLTLVEIAIAAGIVVMLGAFLLPSLSKAKSRGMLSAPSSRFRNLFALSESESHSAIGEMSGDYRLAKPQQKRFPNVGPALSVQRSAVAASPSAAPPPASTPAQTTIVLPKPADEGPALGETGPATPPLSQRQSQGSSEPQSHLGNLDISAGLRGFYDDNVKGTPAYFANRDISGGNQGSYDANIGGTHAPLGNRDNTDGIPESSRKFFEKGSTEQKVLAPDRFHGAPNPMLQEDLALADNVASGLRSPATLSLTAGGLSSDGDRPAIVRRQPANSEGISIGAPLRAEEAPKSIDLALNQPQSPQQTLTFGGTTPKEFATPPAPSPVPTSLYSANVVGYVDVSKSPTPITGSANSRDEETKADNRALGFDWYLGNPLKEKNAIAAQGGTPPPLPQQPPPAVPVTPVTENKTPVLGDLPVVGNLFRSGSAQVVPGTKSEQPTEVGAIPPAEGKGFFRLGPADSTATFANNGNLVSYSGKPSDYRQLGMIGLPSTDTPGALTATNATALARSALDDPGVKTAQDRRYAEAKRNLDELQRFRQMLYLKIASEKTDLELPKSGMVEIVDKAVPEASGEETLWGKVRGTLTGEVERKARLKVGRDQSDVAALKGAPRVGDYDPYFVQTEFEAIQSEAVLGKAIADLHLNEEWGKKYGGGRTLQTSETIALLKRKLDLNPVRNTSLLEIGVKSDKPEEAARIANAVAEAYKDHRLEQRKKLTEGGIQALRERMAEEANQVALAQKEVDDLRVRLRLNPETEPDLAKKVRSAPPTVQFPPEVLTRDNAFSTFSLNVSDVSYKLAAASLEKGVLPEPASIRSEEFINAFDYRDPEPPPGVPVAFAWERARSPFAQNRDLLRFSIKTAAQGRQAGRPMNIVLLLDNSGSMERADRVRIIHEALRVLAAQLQPQDKFSVVTFARTARLWVDGVPGNQAGQVVEEVSGLTPQGGTNLEDAMNLAYQTALRHYLADGINRIVLLTDGAANLGNADPEALRQKVEANRKQGIALDCFGIGWEGYNDDLLEVLSRHGDGRYGFVNTPEEAATEFAAQLAGALHVAASDVKVQVEFNPSRVTTYRQIGYAKHQLTKEQFRDNTVDAAEIGAAESGHALYVIEANPAGDGPLGVVRVRYRIPGTNEYHEHEWAVPYTGAAVALDQSSPALRLAAAASGFSEWLAACPYAAEVTPDQLLGYLAGVPEVYGADARPKKLEWMIRQAKSLAGK